jgi:glucose/arabinose dehydrogenase/PKD repeat protein
VLLAAGTGAAGAATVPPGFEDTLVTTTQKPTALAFAPDGRMLVTTQAGRLQVFDANVLVTALDFSARICSDVERGMLGVAVDPSFALNRQIYVYYTFKKNGVCDLNAPTSPVNRVSRFVLGDNDLVDPTTERVLIDNIPSPNGNHNAGDLEFGKDGFLYVSVGDGGCDWRADSGCALLNDAARDLSIMSGKVLRITTEGDVPPGNPFTGSGTDRCNVTGSTTLTRKCQEIFAYGLRNPFRLAFDPNAAGNLFYINDVGQVIWEEIDLGVAGADYGWNVREGFCARNSSTDCGPPPAGMTNPLYAYDHSTGCTAITGGAFVPNGVWPSGYDDRYLFADLGCGKIYQLDPLGGGAFSATEFATGITAPISAGFGPYGASQALYYITWTTTHQVRRIAYVGSANRSPIARIATDHAFGNLPLTVNFDGTGSSDPDGDSLSYDWNFGDGSPHATSATPSHTYTTAGTYTATLSVSDGRGGQNSASVRIDAGNNPPAVTINSPTVTQRFNVGEQITLHATATDPEDGALAANALSWEVVKHHAAHIHPFLSPTQGNDVPITGPAPEDIASTTNTYLEITVTATDSRGLAATATRDLDPRLVDLTFNSTPSGLQVELAGSAVTTPRTITSWNAWAMPVNAPDQNDATGRPFDFVSWSDGGTQSHAIVTPSSPATYGATFEAAYDRPQQAGRLAFPLVPAFRQTISSTQCSSRGGTPSAHGAPLSLVSCNPPGYLTGTKARLGSRAVASVSYLASPGNPSTPADEADVTIALSATDVRNSATGGDYVPSAGGPDTTLAANLRVSDRYNGSTLTKSGTVTDFDFAIPVNCASTPDPAVGSTCSVSTTADGVLPGSIREGKRMVMQVFHQRLEDAGANGVRGDADDRGFAQGGYFVP